MVGVKLQKNDSKHHLDNDVSALRSMVLLILFTVIEVLLANLDLNSSQPIYLKDAKVLLKVMLKC